MLILRFVKHLLEVSFLGSPLSHVLLQSLLGFLKTLLQLSCSLLLILQLEEQVPNFFSVLLSNLLEGVS